MPENKIDIRAASPCAENTSADTPTGSNSHTADESDTGSRDSQECSHTNNPGTSLKIKVERDIAEGSAAEYIEIRRDYNTIPDPVIPKVELMPDMKVSNSELVPVPVIDLGEDDVMISDQERLADAEPKQASPSSASNVDGGESEEHLLTAKKTLPVDVEEVSVPVTTIAPSSPPMPSSTTSLISTATVANAIPVQSTTPSVNRDAAVEKEEGRPLLPAVDKPGSRSAGTGIGTTPEVAGPPPAGSGSPLRNLPVPKAARTETDGSDNSDSVAEIGREILNPVRKVSPLSSYSVGSSDPAKDHKPEEISDDPVGVKELVVRKRSPDPVLRSKDLVVVMQSVDSEARVLDSDTVGVPVAVESNPDPVPSAGLSGDLLLMGLERVVVAPVPEFTCDICTKGFADISQLSNHKQSEHLVDNISDDETPESISGRQTRSFNYRYRQYCGSRMFILNPDPTVFVIPDSDPTKKRGA
jgi:hypothetical protein